MTTPLPAGTWTLDPEVTTVTIAVKKLLAFTISATLDVTESSIAIDADGNVTGVDVAVAAGSYTSPNAKRNEHVTSGDFLDADTHPTIRFQCATVTPSGADWTADGSLTIKGGTHALPVKISDVSVDGDTAIFTASATADRKAIGVDKLPNLVIAKDLELTVAATARRS